MTTESISAGTVHALPADLRKTLTTDRAARTAWEDLTPLARNEWICWVTSVKKDETRKNHIKRLIEELKEGKRRPCCWIGCIHRKDKAISPSVRAVLARGTKAPKKG
ncbi:MAG TPA: YdeI/OmpD-associated family protein [Candidatus Paceibacterota bacterium]|nr:YdeI/OmpD-associated family protein [Candidatus Paceibacterota bacterium]